MARVKRPAHKSLPLQMPRGAKRIKLPQAEQHHGQSRNRINGVNKVRAAQDLVEMTAQNSSCRQTTKQPIMPTSAATRVFDIPELLEMILLELEPPTVPRIECRADYDNEEDYQICEALRPVTQLFTIQGVSRTFQAAINCSPTIQRKMYQPLGLDDYEALSKGWGMCEEPYTIPQARSVLQLFSNRHWKIWGGGQNPNEIPGSSWRRINLVRGTEREFIRFIEYVEDPDRNYYNEYLQTDSMTDLGKLADWTYEVFNRTDEEHLKCAEQAGMPRYNKLRDFRQC